MALIGTLCCIYILSSTPNSLPLFLEFVRIFKSQCFLPSESDRLNASALILGKFFPGLLLNLETSTMIVSELVISYRLRFNRAVFRDFSRIDREVSNSRIDQNHFQSNFPLSSRRAGLARGCETWNNGFMKIFTLHCESLPPEKWARYFICLLALNESDLKVSKHFNQVYCPTYSLDTTNEFQHYSLRMGGGLQGVRDFRGKFTWYPASSTRCFSPKTRRKARTRKGLDSSEVERTACSRLTRSVTQTIKYWFRLQPWLLGTFLIHGN